MRAWEIHLNTLCLGRHTHTPDKINEAKDEKIEKEQKKKKQKNFLR